MSIRTQLSVLAVAAVCLPLGVVVGSGLVMFGMHDERKFWLVVVVSALCALGGALLLGRHLLRPLDELRAASKRLAGGDLSARAFESGPRELLDACSELGVEGVVAKRVDSPYRPGERSGDWLKLKTAEWKTAHAPMRHRR